MVIIYLVENIIVREIQSSALRIREYSKALMQSASQQFKTIRWYRLWMEKPYRDPIERKLEYVQVRFFILYQVFEYSYVLQEYTVVQAI